MSQSTLDPDNLPATPDRNLGKGHGTDALGPSDRSDTGSDVQGGTAAEEGLSDSDTDAEGTGERAQLAANATRPAPISIPTTSKPSRPRKTPWSMKRSRKPRWSAPSNGRTTSSHQNGALVSLDW
jgi:hypothetical protein